MNNIREQMLQRKQEQWDQRKKQIEHVNKNNQILMEERRS
jgi:hypothetical protein